LQTTATTSVTTIPSTIAKSAHRANIVHRVPRFAINVQLGTNPSKTQHQTKQLVWYVTVDVINQKQAKIIVVTAVLEHINLKTVPLFVFPAMLDCINRKRANRSAQNARKTITPTNPNKSRAKRVTKKKRRIQVPPFVSNVTRDNSCPPTKHVYFAN
jgi:hypothetical protein